MGMGSLGDSPVWWAAGERAGKVLSAKMVEMEGVWLELWLGRWSRGWRDFTAPSGMCACPANGMGSAACIATLSDPLDCCRDRQENLPAEPMQTASGEAVSSRKPPPCQSTWMKGELLQRDSKTPLGSLKSPLEASSSTNAHCLTGRGPGENLTEGGGKGRTPYPVGRV